MYNVYKVIGGATRQVIWVSSGAVPVSIAATLRKYDDTLVHSMAAISSGNGHYYAPLPHPGSAQWLVQEWVAVINANTYVDRQFAHVIFPNVSS